MQSKLKRDLIIRLKDVINDTIDEIIREENQDERNPDELDILLDDGYLRVIVEEEVLSEILAYLDERI